MPPQFAEFCSISRTGGLLVDGDDVQEVVGGVEVLGAFVPQPAEVVRRNLRPSRAGGKSGRMTTRQASCVVHTMVHGLAELKAHGTPVADMGGDQ